MQGLDVPVTCKIRVFTDLQKTLDYARMLQRAGCSVLAVHGRTREQKDAKSVRADWEIIKVGTGGSHNSHRVASRASSCICAYHEWGLSTGLGHASRVIMLRVCLFWTDLMRLHVQRRPLQAMKPAACSLKVWRMNYEQHAQESLGRWQTSSLLLAAEQPLRLLCCRQPGDSAGTLLCAGCEGST